MQNGMLTTEGAEIYYEIRGTGPALLLIAGAGGDAGLFEGAAELLSDTFTVISYDRRGNSRSTGRTDAPMVLAEQADDAKALIDRLTDGKALVFGSSGGAIVALDLCARYPDSVRAVIAHEPPVFRLLSDDVPGADFYAQMTALYQQAGSETMGRQFAAAMGDDGAYAWPEDLLERFLGNVAYLFENEWAEWEKFLPDVAGLSALRAPLLLVGAAQNRGLFNSMPGVHLASQVDGAAWSEFPGVHLEFLVRPQAFVAALRAVLTQLYTLHDDMPEEWLRPWTR